MTDLGIPFDALRDFADAVESIRTRMNATGHTFDGYEDDMGDDGVRDALNDFVDNWRDGRTEIDGQLTMMKDIALSIVEAFEDTDEQRATDLRDNAGGGQGGDTAAQPV